MRTLTVLTEQCLARVPGGTGRYAGQLTAALAAAAPQGWQVRTVTAWHRDVSAARAIGTGWPRRLPAGARTLATLWRYGLPPWPRGDSVHATTVLAPRRRRPLVATVHDMVPWTAPDTLTPHGAAWHRAMMTRVAREADAIVVPTAAVANDLREQFPAAADRVHIIGHGVTAMPVPADAPQRRRSWALPDGTDYALFIGTVEPRKGIDVLLTAMTRPELEQLHLAVVGPAGWGGLDLRQLAQKAGLDEHRLHLLGRRADSDLAAALAGAAALAVPSRAEGFGLPLLEAMAAGVPVVHSTAPALVEVAGDAGMSVPVGDAAALAAGLAAVVGDRDLAERLSGLGRRRAALFTWAGAADRTWQLHLALQA